MKTATKRKPRNLTPVASEALVVEIDGEQRARETGKAGYKEADVRLEQLTKAMVPGQWYSLPGNRRARLRDKFEKTNRIGTGMGVNRYELEVEDNADLLKKL